MKFTPGPGIGGHCIPLDPHYLAWKMRDAQLQDALHRPRRRGQHGDAGVRRREGRQALNDERKAVNGSRVLILGVAYKRDIDDVRESPALDVIRLLESEGAEVVYHDPYVARSRARTGHERHSVELTRRGARAARTSSSSSPTTRRSTTSAWSTTPRSSSTPATRPRRRIRTQARIVSLSGARSTRGRKRCDGMTGRRDDGKTGIPHLVGVPVRVPSLSARIP